MGLTRRQVLWRVELPLARAGDHRRAADRGRLDGLDRDDRRVPAAEGPRLPDLPRAQGADAVQDRDLRGRRCSPSGSRSPATALLVLAPGARPVGAGGSRVILDAANLQHVRRRVPVHRRQPGLPAARRRSSSSSSPAAALGDRGRRSRCRSGVVLGHFHRGSNVAIGTSIVGRALPSLVLIGVFLTVLGIGFVNNMVALAVLATGPILTNSYDARRRRRPRRRSRRPAGWA